MFGMFVAKKRYVCGHNLEAANKTIQSTPYAPSFVRRRQGGIKWTWPNVASKISVDVGGIGLLCRTEASTNLLILE